MLDHICKFVAHQFPRFGADETIYTIKIMMDYASDDLDYWEKSSIWDLYNAAMENQKKR